MKVYIVKQLIFVHNKQAQLHTTQYWAVNYMQNITHALLMRYICGDFMLTCESRMKHVNKEGG